MTSSFIIVIVNCYRYFIFIFIPIISARPLETTSPLVMEDYVQQVVVLRLSPWQKHTHAGVIGVRKGAGGACFGLQYIARMIGDAVARKSACQQAVYITHYNSFHFVFHYPHITPI